MPQALTHLSLSLSLSLLFYLTIPPKKFLAHQNKVTSSIGSMAFLSLSSFYPQFHTSPLLSFPSPTPTISKPPIFNTKPLFLNSNTTTSLIKCSPTPLELSSHCVEEEEQLLHHAWRKIHGSDDWTGLLDPMNPLLRSEIIRYREFAQACYDAFDFDPHSKYCGTSKYSGDRFFDRLHMARHGYEISRYLYATSNINLPNFFQKKRLRNVWSTHANWMGYTAVARDPLEIARLGRRDIVITWPGTVTYLEWIHDLKDILTPARFGDDPSIKVESGFLDLYTMKKRRCNCCSFSAREQVLADIKRLERFSGEELSITVTGHSLGAALALLSAYDIAEMGLNIREDGDMIPVTVFSFSGPRVGNLRFKLRCEELGVKVLRVINVDDRVPSVPGIIANERLQYQRVVEEVTWFPWSWRTWGWSWRWITGSRRS